MEWEILHHKVKTVQYRVTSLKDLIEIIIPHFENFPLITQKRADFILFKKVVDLMNNKEHLTQEGFQQIVNLRASINLGASLIANLKLAFPNTVPVTRPLIKDQEIRDPYWLAGFVSGEGSFTINKTKNVQLVFSIIQHSRDKELMKSLIAYLGCDTYVCRDKKDSVEFRVSKLNDLIEIIIPFFKKYPILGIKALDFSDWCLRSWR